MQLEQSESPSLSPSLRFYCFFIPFSLWYSYLHTQTVHHVGLYDSLGALYPPFTLRRFTSFSHKEHRHLRAKQTRRRAVYLIMRFSLWPPANIPGKTDPERGPSGTNFRALKATYKSECDALPTGTTQYPNVVKKLLSEPRHGQNSFW